MFKWLLHWLGSIFKPAPAPPPTPPPSDLTVITHGVRSVLPLPAGGSVAFTLEPNDLATFAPEKKRSVCCARTPTDFLEVRAYKIKRTPGTEPRYSWAWESGKRYRCELKHENGRLSWWIDGQQQAVVAAGSGAWEVCVGDPWDDAPKEGISGAYAVVL